MLGKIVSTTLIGALMATAAFAESPTKVKDVDVSIDLTAITNPKAAAYWTTVSDDLEGAIVARVTDQIADDGVNISVDISELALSNSFQSAFDIEQSSLVGDVKITSETNNTKFEAFELSVSFEQASPFLPEGYDLAQVTSNSKEYYTAMIGAFADAVVKHLE
jgi:predicted amino acid-binding ACT domain protein